MVRSGGDGATETRVRGAVAAQMQNKFAEYHPAMFRAVWAEEKNVGKEEVLRELARLRESGLWVIVTGPDGKTVDETEDE